MVTALDNPEKIEGKEFGTWLLSQEVTDENDNQTNCPDPEMGRVVMPSSCPIYTAVEGNEATSSNCSFLTRDSEGGVGMPSSGPSHVAMGENEATSVSCSNSNIRTTRVMLQRRSVGDDQEVREQEEVRAGGQGEGSD